MTTFTINLNNEKVDALKKLSTQFNLSPEELIKISIDDLLSRPDEQFQKTVKNVLKENSELYKRLAK